MIMLVDVSRASSSQADNTNFLVGLGFGAAFQLVSIVCAWQYHRILKKELGRANGIIIN